MTITCTTFPRTARSREFEVCFRDRSSQHTTTVELSADSFTQAATRACEVVRTTLGLHDDPQFIYAYDTSE